MTDHWQIDPADPSVGIPHEQAYHECDDPDATTTSPEWGVYECTCGARLDRNEPEDY